MAQQLRSGYTTGTHATATLVACLGQYFQDEIYDSLNVTLPKNIQASIDVVYEGEYDFSSIKVDNDDLDVTKGAKISCKLLKNNPQNLKTQMPTHLKINNFSLYIWAGDGVGVVTKKGLKIAPNYPAINPTPLEMMQQNTQEIVSDTQGELHAIFSVENGEQIAKDTANVKVGVLGGISILGTRGIVKPVSATAYIESIEAEIDVGAAFDEGVIVFTLGNSAVDFAKEFYDETSIVEIGNFVYDALAKLHKHHFKKIVFITSVAKMTKVAQGFKNTHNRFGSIDFDEVKQWLVDELDLSLDGEFLTLKGVLEALETEQQNRFVKQVSKKSALVLDKWCNQLGVIVDSIEVITLPQQIIFIKNVH